MKFYALITALTGLSITAGSYVSEDYAYAMNIFWQTGCKIIENTLWFLF